MCYQSLTLDNETKSLTLNEKMKHISRNKSSSCSAYLPFFKTNKKIPNQNILVFQHSGHPVWVSFSQQC